MEQPPEVGDFLPSRSHLSEFEQEQDTSQTSQLEDPQTAPEAAETPQGRRRGGPCHAHHLFHLIHEDVNLNFLASAKGQEKVAGYRFNTASTQAQPGHHHTGKRLPTEYGVYLRALLTSPHLA